MIPSINYILGLYLYRDKIRSIYGSCTLFSLITSYIVQQQYIITLKLTLLMNN